MKVKDARTQYASAKTDFEREGIAIAFIDSLQKEALERLKKLKKPESSLAVFRELDTRWKAFASCHDALTPDGFRNIIIFHQPYTAHALSWIDDTQYSNIMAAKESQKEVS